MLDIKTKDSKPKSIKVLDKVTIWTERIKDPILYVNEKSDDFINNESNINDYAEDKIKSISNSVRNEVLHVSKRINHQTIEYVKKRLINNGSKDIKIKVINKNKTIKTKNTIKNTEKVAKKTVGASKKMINESRKVVIESSKKLIQTTKIAIKVTVSTIKAIIIATKSLIGIITSCGIVSIIIIIVMSVVGMLIVIILQS